MTTNDMDAEALLLDQTCFALHAGSLRHVPGAGRHPTGGNGQPTPHAHKPVAVGCDGRSHGQEHARAIARSGIQTSHERCRAVDQATHNKSFKRHFCKPQPLRTLAEYTVLLSQRRLRDKLPARRASSSKQIVVTVSQELAARIGARFNGHAPTRTARLVGWMPSAIGHLQGGSAAHSRQILVTVSRASTPRHGRELNCTEVTRMADERDVGLAAGQA